MQKWWLAFWAALALTLTAVAPASAQTSAGNRAGSYQIQQARYGTPERNVDVTRRLRELARSNRSFRLDNDLMGTDPDQGRVKALRIYARGSDGVNRVFEYAEGDVIDGRRFSGWAGGQWGRPGGDGDWHGSGGNRDEGAYQIVQARYGTERRNVDVTERLKELARQDRNFRMGNETFGVDPDEGRVKTLRIYARDARGGTRTFEYVEGSVVDGAQFSGWGGGNWGDTGGWNGRPVPGGGAAPPPNAGRPSGLSGLNIVRATYGAGDQRADVSDIVRRHVLSGRVEIVVNNDNLAVDPAPGRQKTLVVVYTTYAQPQQQQVQVPEGVPISIP